MIFLYLAPLRPALHCDSGALGKCEHVVRAACGLPRQCSACHCHIACQCKAGGCNAQRARYCCREHGLYTKCWRVDHAAPLWCCPNGWSTLCSGHCFVLLAPPWEVLRQLTRLLSCCLAMHGILIRSGKLILLTKPVHCVESAQMKITPFTMHMVQQSRIRISIADWYRGGRLGGHALQHLRPQPLHPDGGVLRLDRHWGSSVTQGAHQACLRGYPV